MENAASASGSQHVYAPYGTVLEAAFVDPAYVWPPPDGEGRNAIELQASVNLMTMDDDDGATVLTTESQKERMRLPEKPSKKKN